MNGKLTNLSWTELTVKKWPGNYRSVFFIRHLCCLHILHRAIPGIHGSDPKWDWKCSAVFSSFTVSHPSIILLKSLELFHDLCIYTSFSQHFLSNRDYCTGHSTWKKMNKKTKETCIWFFVLYVLKWSSITFRKQKHQSIYTSRISI